MKKYSVASPSLMFLTIVYPIPTSILFLIAGLFFNHSFGILGTILFPIFSYCIIWLFGFTIYHNAYCKFKICSDGVKNNKIFIPWSEIKEINVCEVELFKYSFIPTISLPILYFGPERNKSFVSLNPNNFVFFSSSAKNVELFKKYCGEDLEKSINKIFFKT